MKDCTFDQEFDDGYYCSDLGVVTHQSSFTQAGPEEYCHVRTAIERKKMETQYKQVYLQKSDALNHRPTQQSNHNIHGQHPTLKQPTIINITKPFLLILLNPVSVLLFTFVSLFHLCPIFTTSHLVFSPFFVICVPFFSPLCFLPLILFHLLLLFFCIIVCSLFLFPSLFHFCAGWYVCF